MAVLSTQETRVRQYFDQVIGPELQQTRQRKSFAAYALGILGEGERKRCEPIAARSASGRDEQTTLKAVDHPHNRLLHFLAYSPWNDEAVRLTAAQYAIEEIDKFRSSAKPGPCNFVSLRVSPRISIERADASRPRQQPSFRAADISALTHRHRLSAMAISRCLHNAEGGSKMSQRTRILRETWGYRGLESDGGLLRRD